MSNAELNIPTTKMERWKYTNLPSAVKQFDTEAVAPDVVCDDPDNIVRRLSDDKLPSWVTDILNAPPAGAEEYKDMNLWELCQKYTPQGLFIDVPDGKKYSNPVEITITGHDGDFFVPRTVFRLGKGAELTVIEHHEGKGSYWNNRVTQIIVGEGAKLHHYRLQDNSIDAVYTQNTHVRIAEGAIYDGFVLTTGSALSRNQLHVDLEGEGAHCEFKAINILSGKQLGDTTLTFNHLVPNCTSSQLIRSVLDDRARGVFQGKVVVARDAQKTDAQQLSKALILSEAAEMDNKPELEIYADDVKCSHGATTGQLDEDALFYMCSRGIAEEDAKALLVTAFVNEIVDSLEDSAVKDKIQLKVQECLG